MSDVRCKYFNGTMNPEEAKVDKPVDCKCGDDTVAINPTYCCSDHHTKCPWYKKKEGAGSIIDAPAVASEQTAELTQHDVAIELHAEIMQYKAVAASALYEMCVRLKKMRDEKLYAELGYTSFGAYCEQKAGIKERQGYNYIKALENLGKDVLQSNAKIGITKLELLTHVPELDRADFVESTDLETITVEDLKKKISELEKENGLKAEQISMFEEQVKATSESTDDLKKEIEKLKSNLQSAEAKASEYKSAAESATKRAEEAENRPIEVAVTEIPDEEVEKIRIQAARAATNAAEKEKKEALKKLREEMASAYEDREKSSVVKQEALEKANEEMSAEIATLKKQLADAEKLNATAKPAVVSEGDATVKVKMHFNIIQEQVDGLLEALEDIEDTERKNKYKKNLRSFAENIIAAVEE